MNKILLALSLSAISFGASAQTYDKLWEKAQSDISKDLPQQALLSVMRIHHKAVSEHNDAQLLRAELMQLALKGEVSTDSVDVLVGRMERALQQESRPVMQALWHSALAQVYEQRNNSIWNTDTVYAAKARHHATAALARPLLLAEAPAADYMPLFKAGKQSRLFGNDLLHILLSQHKDQTERKESEVIQEAIDVYRKLGRMEAVLLLTLQQLEATRSSSPVLGRVDDDARYKELHQLAQTYTSSPCNALTYAAITHLQQLYADESRFKPSNDSLLIADARRGIALYGTKGPGAELSNFVNRMEAPAAEMKQLAQTALPGDTLHVDLKVRNLPKVAVNFVRIADSSQQLDASDLDPEELRKKVKSGIVSRTITCPVHPAHEWHTQRINLTVPEKPGIYMAEICTDGHQLDYTVMHVTALSALSFSYPNGQSRITVVDSRTGHPVKGARIVEMGYDTRSRSKRQLHAYTADSEGNVTLSVERRGSRFYASTDTDKASLPLTLTNLQYNRSFTENARTTIDLFTDRAIYRPGQTVQVSGVAYTKQGDEISVVQAYEGRLLLRDANRKVVDSLSVKCDDFGAFSARFQLPEHTLSGYFSLEMGNGSSVGYGSIRVEEYKRPTFTAETLPVKSAYALGDSVLVEGKAQTYTGLPVGQARVQYSVSRSSWGWHAGLSHPFQEQHGEVQTDAEGLFAIPVLLAADEEEKQAARATRYVYTVTYTVTAENGETTQGSATLHAANRRTWIEHNVPTELCKVSAKPLPTLSVRQVNASGQNADVLGHYLLRTAQGKEMERGSFRTTVPFTPKCMDHLPDGQYEMVFSTEEGIPADTARFDFFTDRTMHPVNRKQILFAHNFASASADSVHVLIGSPRKDVLVFCDVLAGGRLIESRRFVLTDSVAHDYYAYRPEWGDGADIYYAFMQDGRLYTHHVQVRKPLPEKRLKLEWKTFRSRLTPGQHEQWTLRVTHPDGTPAESQVMACLYDGSLDALARHSWNFSNVQFYRRSTYAQWNSRNDYQPRLSLNGSLPFRTIQPAITYDRPQDFTRWDPDLFVQVPTALYESVTTADIRLQGTGRHAPRMMKAMALSDLSEAVPNEEVMDKAAPQAPTYARGNAGQGAAPSPTAMPRTNFSETAFFRPALRTDANGEVSIDFTLPESTTQWNFHALAHSHYMDYGATDTTIVARKDFMVNPALPRFIRRGDEVELPVSVSNLKPEAVNATLHLLLTDALTGKTIQKESQAIKLQGNGSQTFGFTYHATADAPMLICRITAEGKGFSDGEEHYMPILSNEVEVVRTLPFSLTEKGSTTLRIDSLYASAAGTHRSLTVELTSNPTWTAVTSLPTLTSCDHERSATEWGTQLYALALGECLAKANPSIREWTVQHQEETDALAHLKLDGFTDLTPWLRNARQEAERGKALSLLFDESYTAVRKHTALDKLAALQQADGGWSWYPGMTASPYVTTDVALLLARIEKLTGCSDAHRQLVSALDFLKARMAEEVTLMKKAERETKQQMLPSTLQLNYLYLRTLMGLKCDDADSRFLFNRAKQLRHQLSMQGKAQLAVVLADNGEQAEGRLAIQSLLEHTVSTPEMGRYFDTTRAASTSSSYRIPTQCAAIEALMRFGMKQEAEEMRLWLMQCKRTQMWETARASADAVYALLSDTDEDPQHKLVMSLSSTQPVYFTLLRGEKIVGVNARKQSSTASSAGYFRETYNESPATEATTVRVRKDSDGTAWGAVYASCTLPASEVKREGQGLHIQRTMQVKQGAAWINMTSGTSLKKGDRVRQVFTVRADRDYDFVSITASRPACTEPTEPLSGYSWKEGLSAYRAVHDASTDYFVERLAKGTHTFTEELFVDRAGHYASGLCTVQCVYAPEFTATSDEVTMKCE